MQSGVICLVAVFLLGGAAFSAAANDSIGGPGLVDVPALEARARRAGLRMLAGNHLVLVTDRPLRAGDGVEELPAVFDQAFAGGRWRALRSRSPPGAATTNWIRRPTPTGEPSAA